MELLVKIASVVVYIPSTYLNVLMMLWNNEEKNSDRNTFDVFYEIVERKNHSTTTSIVVNKHSNGNGIYVGNIEWVHLQYVFY